MNRKVRYDEGLDSDEIASYESKHDITPSKIMKEKDTYEIWYLGDFWKEGPKTRETFNEFLIDGGELMYHGTKAGLTVGGIEILHRNGNDTETIWEFNFAD